MVGWKEDTLAALGAISDFGSEAVIQSDSSTALTANGPGVATISGTGARQVVHVVMSAPGWVIVSNSRWRGWHARSGGREIPIRFGDHAFIAFHLPAGEHTVKVMYRPKSFVIGAWISGLTAILLLAYALIPSSAMTFFMSAQTSFFADGVRRRYAG